MRILITGAAGFAGRHLVPELVNSGHTCIGFDVRYDRPVPGLHEAYSGDLQEADAVSRAVARATPDACIHLGGLAFVPAGQFHPNLMLSVNTLGTYNLLEAFREYNPDARVLVITSAQIYALQDTGEPIREDGRPSPIGMYSISKAGADMATLAFHDRYQMHTMTARPNNHTGPGQSPQFVVPSFARQVKAIAEGKQRPVMKVGNLESERVFTDVRDVVRAYRLLIEKGRAGEAYNISSENMVRIRTVLDKFCALAGVTPEIQVDPAKLRPTDKSPVLDMARLQETTGWDPRISLDQTLEDIYDDIDV